LCAFFCVCVQVKALCDELITRPRSPTVCLRSRKTEVNGEVHGGRPRPPGAVGPGEKKKNLILGEKITDFYCVERMPSN
jgi:hypothetical protein